MFFVVSMCSDRVPLLHVGVSIFFSHTQRVSVTLAIRLCPSSLSASAWTFLVFRLLEPLHGFASNYVWMFLGWTPTKFVKIGVLPLFFMKYKDNIRFQWKVTKKWVNLMSFDMATDTISSFMFCKRTSKNVFVTDVRWTESKTEQQFC